MKLKRARSVIHQSTAFNASYLLSEADRRLRTLEFSVATLIERTKTGHFWADGFAEVSSLLETVLLTTFDFCATQSHLQNSVDYCQLGEFGAAAFELRIVRGILQKL